MCIYPFKSKMGSEMWVFEFSWKPGIDFIGWSSPQIILGKSRMAIGIFIPPLVQIGLKYWNFPRFVLNQHSILKFLVLPRFWKNFHTKCQTLSGVLINLNIAHKKRITWQVVHNSISGHNCIIVSRKSFSVSWFKLDKMTHLNLVRTSSIFYLEDIIVVLLNMFSVRNYIR